MSEFDRRAFLQRRSYAPLRDDVVEDTAEAPLPDAAPAEEREGLPPSFRMRADSHYVDLITSRAVAPPVQSIAIKDIDAERPARDLDLRPLIDSIAALGVVQPLVVRRRRGRFELIAGANRLAAATAAGLSEVPCLLWDVDDERSRALAQAENLKLAAAPAKGNTAASPAGLPAGAAREMANSLATIESCLNLLTDGDRPLRERVAASLVRAEAHRARWMAEAYTVLDGTSPRLQRKPLSPGSLIEGAFRSLEAECRLAGVTTSLAIDEARTLSGDPHLLPLALAGVLGTLVALLQKGGGSSLSVRVRTPPASRMVAIECSQDDVPMPAEWVPLTPADVLPDWAGTATNPLGLAVASRVAGLHGGHVHAAASPRGGCVVTMVLPAGD